MSDLQTEKTYNSELFIMTKAVIAAAQAIVRDFGELERLQVSRKGVGNFITSADLYAEKKIIGGLQKSGLNYHILSEELGYQQSSNKKCEYTWVIDPIDGTNNFRRGIPYFCTTIALVKDSIPVASVCLDPVRSSLFKCAHNAGAYVDKRNRLRVTSKISLLESVVAIHSNNLLIVEKLMNARSIIRRTGSVALDLAYLASGKYDAVVVDDVKWWDIASGIIMVIEAGGFVSYSDDNGSFKLRAACTKRLLNIINDW